MSDNPAQQGPPPGGITGAIKGMFTGTGARGMTAPAPIKTPIGRQDSLPELVGTPSGKNILHGLKMLNYIAGDKYGMRLQRN